MRHFRKNLQAWISLELEPGKVTSLLRTSVVVLLLDQTLQNGSLTGIGVRPKRLLHNPNRTHDW